jgi:hypothetical protein
LQNILEKDSSISFTKYWFLEEKYFPQNFIILEKKKELVWNEVGKNEKP